MVSWLSCLCIFIIFSLLCEFHVMYLDLFVIERNLEIMRTVLTQHAVLGDRVLAPSIAGVTSRFSFTMHYFVPAL